MDELVKQSLTKWPNVPHCYGWLALDARGAFRMRDEVAQLHTSRATLFGMNHCWLLSIATTIAIAAAPGIFKMARNACMSSLNQHPLSRVLILS